MKYPLFAAALLAFAVTACDQEAATPTRDAAYAPAAEQAPAPVEEASQAYEPSVIAIEVDEVPGAAAEEAAVEETVQTSDAEPAEKQ